MLLVTPRSYPSVGLAERTDLTALLMGPTGSGKTEFARLLHDKSERRDRPFVTVNLASLAAGVFESELFGHEKGAFTSAMHSRRGRILMADTGTLLLDEVGELLPAQQARLLEFVQHRTFYPVGSSHPKAADVRIIAATNSNLEEAVKAGKFRKDLYHRLRVLQIDFHSLSETNDEFGPLVHKVLARVCEKRSKTIVKLTESAALALEQYSWPGNLRELFHALEYAVELAVNRTITLNDLPGWLIANAIESEAETLYPIEAASNLLAQERFDLWSDYEKTLNAVEKRLINLVLTKNNGKKAPTARDLGMNKAKLLRRLTALGLKKDKTK